jgi:hypothetical protein
MNDLKFVAKYSRKVQPWPFENISFGLALPFPIDEADLVIPVRRDSEVETAFKVVVDLVETEIDRRLQELYAEERRR